MTSHDAHHPELPFDAEATGFIAHNAVWLAMAGNLAYEDEKTIRETVRKWGFNRFRFLHASTEMGTSGTLFPVDTQGFVCTGPKATLIAFRGTEVLNVKDWFTDLMVGAVPAPVGLGKVHGGFDAAYAVIRPQVELALGEQHDGHLPIWITGHSLGGALALLAGVHLVFERKLPVQGVYTFGQPRVGDRTHAKFVRKVLKDRVVRFVNNQDIVPKVPTPGMFLSYRHHVPELRFDAEGNLTRRKSLIQRSRELISRPRKALPSLGFEALTDHSMENYLEHLRKHARRDV